MFIYDNNHYILLFICSGGGGGARLRQDPAGGGNRSVPGEPRWQLPPLLRVGASAAFRRQRAGGTIRVRERGARRSGDSPGREWAGPCARCGPAGRGGTIRARRGFCGTGGHITCAVRILPSRGVYNRIYFSRIYPSFP